MKLKSALVPCVALALLAGSNPADAKKDVPKAAKTKPAKSKAQPAKTKTPLPKAKRVKNATAVRSVKMRKAVKVVANAVPNGLKPVDQPPNPFSDMPPQPHPKAAGVTADRFSIGPAQLETPHGHALLRNATSVSPRAIALSARGYIALLPKWSWVQDHDLMVECWGDFPNGQIKVAARGRNEATGKYMQVGNATIDPPAKISGRIKVAIPTKGVAPLDRFRIYIYDADRKGSRRTWIYQCIVDRV